MGGATWWGQLLLVAAALHVGLELVVQLVVYPALARSSRGPDARDAHQDHTRRMSVAVAPVYGLLVLGAAGRLAADPSPGAAAAAALVLATLAVTGFVAVPAHEAAVAETDAAVRARLHRRLARTDLVRLLLALSLLLLAWGLLRVP